MDGQRTVARLVLERRAFDHAAVGWYDISPVREPIEFLEVKNAREIPKYWGQYRYYGLIYYGGTYLDLAFAAYAPMKVLGAPAFPTAPIVLRTISFLAGLLSIALLYNFGRRHAGRFAAVFAVSALLFEPNFGWMTTTIHPDVLQLALALLALVVATRHARLGDIRSAIALGTLLGLIQGTKSGAPYVLPLVLVTVLMGAWGAHRGESALVRLWYACKRLALVGAVSIAAFVLSTPYILFDPYYLSTTRGAWHVLSGTSPLIPITFSTWYYDIVAELGRPLVVAILVGVVLFVIRTARRPNGHSPLALVLGVGNLVWFTGVGRFWVVLYYLLPALALLSIFAGDLIGRAGNRMASLGRVGFWARRVVLPLALLAVVLGNGRAPALAMRVAEGIDAQRTPQLRLGAWAEKHVPPKSTILFDDQAYFDPARFPIKATNAGVMRYTDLIQSVLGSSFSRTEPSPFGLP